jgi:DtxR family transcriptional regulator, Mn-dependent transcriptional regulator
MPDELTESQEDYLEAIYRIETGEGGARSSEVAEAMGVKRPSVTTALKTLADKGLVDYSPYDRVRLTPDGERAARSVVARHGVIRQFLVDVLGIAPADAQVAACRLEHAFSPQVFARFVQYLSALESCPERPMRWDAARGFACGKGVCRDAVTEHAVRETEGREANGRLRDLEVGDEAEVTGYRGQSSDYRQKLLAMGLTRGVHIRVIKVAPLGDPVEIEVRGFRLTVRRDEADALGVRRVGPTGGRRDRRGRGGRGAGQGIGAAG